MRKITTVLSLTVVCVLTGDAKVAKAQTPAVFEDYHLFASDGQGGVFPDLGDQFGLSVAVTGSSGSEVAIVGARSDDTPGGTSAGSAYIYRFNGTNWVEEAHLFAFDGAANDQYGQSVSIGGAPGAEVAIVGAWVDNTVAGIDAGSVYIYRFNGTIWLFEEQLVASDGAANDFFGTSVSISGTSGNEVAIVGAVLDDTAGGNNAGSAYIYRFNGTSWVEETHIFASDGQGDAINGDQFGDTVSINSNGGSEIAIVGAFLDNTSAGTDAGSAYVFRFNGTNWVEEGHLFASDAFEADRFGDAVSITGAPGNEVAIVGAPFDLAMGIVRAGSAYVFRFNGANWIEESHLFGSFAARDDWFGGSVSISGVPGAEVAIVGADHADPGGSNAGAAYVYRFNGSAWAEERHLLASDAAAIDLFGGSVAVSGDVAFVGANSDDTTGGTDAGSVYVFNCIDDCRVIAVLDPGQGEVLNPGGGSGVPIIDSLVDFTNVSGAAGATVTAGQTNINQFPAAGGFGVLDRQLLVDTTLNDGEFFMQLSIPFGQVDLDAFGIADPLSIDLTYYNTVSGNWELAVAANTVNSPGFGGPVGDRIVVSDTVIPALSTDLGDYGVYWNPATLQGFSWANVDHTTVFAVGAMLPACPSDIAPPGGDGAVNVTDLLALLAAWGPNPGHPADTNGDDSVNVTDLLALLAAWGPCP